MSQHGQSPLPQMMEPPPSPAKVGVPRKRHPLEFLLIALRAVIPSRGSFVKVAGDFYEHPLKAHPQSKLPYGVRNGLTVAHPIHTSAAPGSPLHAYESPLHPTVQCRKEEDEARSATEKCANKSETPSLELHHCASCHYAERTEQADMLVCIAKLEYRHIHTTDACKHFHPLSRNVQ